MPWTGTEVRERIVSDGDNTLILAQQNCDDVIRMVRHAEDTITKKSAVDGTQYLGSVPLLVAQVWAKEIGAAMGTREYATYARKRLLSGEFNYLKAVLK